MILINGKIVCVHKKKKKERKFSNIYKSNSQISIAQLQHLATHGLLWWSGG